MADIQAIRRTRLAELVREFGTQEDLAAAIGKTQGYISRLLKGKKIGEDSARNIEKGALKPAGWLDRPDDAAPRELEWPFPSIAPEFWHRLHPSQKKDIESAVAKMILGAAFEQAQTQSEPQRTKRRG